MNYFDVWLEAAGEEISQNWRFHFDWRHCERPYFVLFANSVGGIDDVYFGGFPKEDFSLESSMTFYPQKRSNTVFDRTLVPTSKSGHNKWTLNSGFKSWTQILHLRDLMVARHAWLLYPTLNVENRMVIPVTIQSYSSTIVNHKNNIHNITVELSEAHTSQYSFDNKEY